MKHVRLSAVLMSCGPTEPSCADVDGDGFADAACGGSDCDDSNPDVRPDALDPGDDWSSHHLSSRGMPRAVVSSDDELWVAYTRTEDPGEQTDMRVGHWNGSTFDWETPPIRKPDLDRNFAVGMDDDGVLHMLLNNEHSDASTGNVLYATRTDGTWDVQERYVWPDVPGLRISMHVSGDGVAHSLTTLAEDRVYLGSISDPEDEAERLPLGLGYGLLMDESNETVLLGTPHTEFEQHVWWREGDEWASEPVRLYRVRAVHQHGVLAFIGLGYESGDLELRIGVGPSAVFETIGETAEGGYNVRATADGSVHVVWHTPNKTVMYRRRSPNGAWSDPHTFGTASSMWFRAAQLAVRGSGEVHVWHNDGQTDDRYHVVHHVKPPGDGVDNDCDGLGGPI